MTLSITLTRRHLPFGVLIMALAMAFTLSCSNSDDNGTPSVSSSSEVSNGNSSSSSEEYGTAKVCEQVWLAKNLNYNVPGSRCYGEGAPVSLWDDETKAIIVKTLSNAEIQANCDKYGRLYDWATAMALPPSCNSSSCANQVQSKHRGICPEGYHIPSYEEWNALFNCADPLNYLRISDSSKLKSTSGWINRYDGLDYGGTDEYGFSALAGGRGGYMQDGSFDALNCYGHWWISTEYDGESNLVRVRYMSCEGDYDDQTQTFFGKTLLFSVRCLQD